MASSSRQNNIEKILKDLESDTVFDKNIVSEVEQSFLDYAMSVITSRALPDLKDGLKPVHRRIIYSAYQEKLFNNAKYKKSAALVGTVMGSYHPHGDSSIYDALTRMAQDFSLRYPLIEGQGNFGSIDGDSPAAMRYTEARLSKIGEYFLDGIDEDCIDFMDNYDQSKKEPVVLPTLIPNILVNGTTGIAVGLATNIPPHNLTEVMDAILMLIENENLSEEEIHKVIKGPDFPTGGEIFKYEAVRRYFSESSSKRSLSFRIRSKVEVEEVAKRNLLIVKEIPYGIKKTKITEGIVALIKPDKNGVVKSPLLAENIVDIRDESNLEGIRLVIECKKDVSPQVILNNLYKFTPLQSSYSPNLTILIDNEPKRVSLPEILRLYVKHQLEMLRRRTQFQLSVINKRLHILDGRIKISSDVLEAIKIINSSETPEEDIKNKYSLSDEQVEDIFKLTIGSLKRISVDKLKTEFDDKTKIKAEKESILGSEQKTKQVLSQQIKDIRDKFGDERRTKINYESSGKIEYVDLFHFEEMVIFLSRKGYVSQVSLDEFKLRRRGGAGVKGAVTHKDDAPKMMLTCFGKDDILFFTDTGRVFRLKAYEMNLRSDKNNRGRITTNLLPGLRKNEEKVVNIFNLSEKDYSDDLFLLFVTKKGMVKKTNISQFRSIRSNGKFAFKLRDGDELKFVIRVKDDSDICLASSGGRLVRFKASDCRPLSRTASGVKAMKLIAKQELISASSTYDGDYVFSIAENGKGKLTHISQFRLTKRGSKIGVIAHKIGSKTGKLLGCTLVKKDDEFLLMTSMSKINRFKISDVRSQSRITSGVNLFKLEEKEKLIYFSKYYPDAEELEEDDFKEE